MPQETKSPPTQPQAPKKKAPLNTTTTIIIVGIIAVVIFFVMPSLGSKPTKPAEAPVVTKPVEKPAAVIEVETLVPATSINTAEIPKDIALDQAITQFQVVTQQLITLKQQVAALESSIRTLNEMIDLHEKLMLAAKKIPTK